MLPALRPWERITWSPEREKIMYRDWGLFFTQNQNLDIAARYYDKSLELDASDSKALYWRSRCKRDIAQTAGALIDGLDAQAKKKMDAWINLEVCKAIYELNQFENGKIELHDNMRKFKGNKVGSFQYLIHVIDENFNDSIGDTLGPFILENQKHFSAVLADIERRTTIDERPLWKILKEQDKCDVLSILEKEEIFLSPREIARRYLGYKVFNQIYFHKNWKDVLFLKTIRNNPNLLLEQSKVSTPILKHLADSKYEIVKVFLKMLQARSPLYNEKLQKCPDKKIAQRNREQHLYRIQYQTHRNMHTILRTIRHLRKMGQIEKLTKYIEEAMGDYVVIKTHRVMPWKFEFIQEVYNTLALAHADRFILPENIEGATRRMSILFQLTDKNKDHVVPFKFGDRSTYQDPSATDYGMITYKQQVARLEKRIHFAKYGIEKCYLLHEIARNHLRRSHFDECCSVARKACEEAKKCESHLWNFLSLILMSKSHAVFHKIELCREVLEEALLLAIKLKSPQLYNFVEICIHLNVEEMLSMKKRCQSFESVRKHRSKTSLYCQYNTTNSQESEETHENLHSTESEETRENLNLK